MSEVRLTITVPIETDQQRQNVTEYLSAAAQHVVDNMEGATGEVYAEFPEPVLA